jgi:uncharacterized membrane protein YphA (DoxX/SURF4 family)
MTRNRIVPVVLTLFVSFVFIQSLFFKFTDSVETQYIFNTLDDWGASLGFAGLFGHGGIFSQYVVGSAELIASSLLLLGLTRQLRILRPIGALLGLGVISGAIFFHLFTPLGVAVPNADGSSDGGCCSASPARSLRRTSCFWPAAATCCSASSALPHPGRRLPDQPQGKEHGSWR